MLLAPVPALFYALLSQKLAPAEKNSTDISAASATFCISVFSDVLITLSELCYFYNYTFSASFLSLTQSEGELLLSLSQDYPPPPGEGEVLNFCKENYLVSFTEMNFLACLSCLG